LDILLDISVGRPDNASVGGTTGALSVPQASFTQASAPTNILVYMGQLLAAYHMQAR
jgi:hypothetical protein